MAVMQASSQTQASFSTYRSSRLEEFYMIAELSNISNITGKHLYKILFITKFQAVTLLKRESDIGVSL